MVCGRIERGRNDEAIGLDGTVHLGFVTADDKTGSGIPGRLTLTERASAFGSFLEKFSGGREIVGGVENVVVEGVADGVAVDLDVGQEVEESRLSLERFLEIVNFMAERRDAGFQFVLDVGWDWDAFGRRSGELAGGSVGGGGQGSGQQEKRAKLEHGF